MSLVAIPETIAANISAPVPFLKWQMPLFFRWGSETIVAYSRALNLTYFFAILFRIRKWCF